MIGWKEVAHRRRTGLGSQDLKGHVGLAPIGSVQVANCNCVHLIIVVTPQRHFEHSVLALLIVTIENRIRVGHGMAWHDFRSHGIFGKTHDCKVLEKGVRFRKMNGGHGLDVCDI